MPEQPRAALAGGAPRAAVVNLTLNAAAENFVGDPPFWYHDEPRVLVVRPAGGPVDGGTNLSVMGEGFEPGGDAAAIFTSARLRCMFDSGGVLRDADGTLRVTVGERHVLPGTSAPSWRNDSLVLCEAPPSHDMLPPYINHGGSVAKSARSLVQVVAKRR